MSTWCHSRDECSQAFPVLIFTNFPIPCTGIIVNANGRSRGKPGTKASSHPYVYHRYLLINLLQVFPSSSYKFYSFTPSDAMYCFRILVSFFMNMYAYGTTKLFSRTAGTRLIVACSMDLRRLSSLMMFAASQLLWKQHQQSLVISIHDHWFLLVLDGYGEVVLNIINLALKQGAYGWDKLRKRPNVV